ncbi:MAG: hypothetical protein M1147_12940 [Nitrospirae bacterium]|nr:hypothetical protein [Nitrospirota bacterium]MCL5978994.1 hypothetical protein [Nitrospirota bacterium]
MSSNSRKTLTGAALRDAGWNALVKNMGLVNATRFILQYESGYGDYTEIKKKLFKGKNVADICREIKKK